MSWLYLYLLVFCTCTLAGGRAKLLGQLLRSFTAARFKRAEPVIFSPNELQRTNPTTNITDASENRRKGHVERLGEILKKHVQRLRQTSNRKVDLVFLVDSSASVGGPNFFNEIKFVRKLLADFTVDQYTTRVSVVTFSSKSRVERHIDHLTNPSNEKHKCSLLEEELPAIGYTGGGTYTYGAIMEAQEVLKFARPDAAKVVFLITDGYSNGEDPRPPAAKLRNDGIEIFTIGIQFGNYRELYSMASEPKDEHTYILDSFDEFEALARRALHEDLHAGIYIEQQEAKCAHLCEEGDDCCDDRASCQCGTHTGKYECICNAGYYGNGLKEGCTACPDGTYKDESSPGDKSTCIPCPDVHQVSPAGSFSLEHCTCKKGYRKTGQNACAALTCPKPLLPENGKFANGKCNNVFNAACGVRCKPGYKLTGTSVRLCQENGTWSGTPAKCEVKKCPPLRPPKNSQMMCTTTDFSFPTRCAFTCKTGFNLVGSRSRQCLAIALWDGIPVQCREVKCPPLPEMVDGKITPRYCTTNKTSFGTVCKYSCRSGYKIVGSDRKQCTVNGHWTPSNEHDNKCVDNTPPIIFCPKDLNVDADNNENTAIVKWEIPTAVDNSGYLPTVSVIPAMVPPIALPIARTKVTYIAEDGNKNKARCSFTVIVKDTQPPRIDRCNSPAPFVQRDKKVHVKWETPLFSDNSQEDVTVKCTHKEGYFPLGKTIVNCTAFDRYGNNNTCSMVIVVKEHACSNPVPPISGNITCKTRGDGVECVLSCKAGYGFAVAPADAYFCNYDTGKWKPKDHLPFPDCAASAMSNHVVQTTKLQFKSKRPCDDRLLLNQVESTLRKQLTPKVNEYCNEDVICELEYLSTECLPEDDENRVELDTNSIDNQLNTAPLRRRRDVINNSINIGVKVTRPPEHPESKVKVAFEVSGTLDDLIHVEVAQQQELVSAITHVIDRLQEDARNGEFDTMMADQQIRFQQLRLEDEAPSFTCRAGRVLRELSCVSCPMGTYFNVVSEKCEGCEVGTYQPREQQPTCLVCPNNTSTASNSSKSISQCKGQCLPGSFSFDGLEPCETCREGTFQPDYASTSCYACPENKTTWRRGTRSWKDCGVMCPKGFVSKTGLAPCFPCPRGYFQPNLGKSSCFLCPGHVKTTHTGSTKIEDCVGLKTKLTSYSSISTSELVINDCFQEPCKNGATCQNLNVGYTCECQPGWQGLHCEIEVDECLSNPCVNNGTCEDGLNDFNCVCTQGHTGKTCDIDIDECESSPCLNNATCVDQLDSYLCYCLIGFNGTHCQENIDDCARKPCKNGATCIDKIAAFGCECPLGFEGVRCETNINECASSPCLNGGICIDEINKYRCQCLRGFTGVTCEVDINECASNPCQNYATCTDLVGSYTCTCQPSYSGVTCQTKLSSGFDMTFPTSGTTTYVAVENIYNNMTEITVCFWMKTTDKENYGTAVSYATDKTDNALTILDYSGFVLYVNGEKVITDVTANDGKWHHICVTWASGLGSWRIYKDAELKDQGLELANNTYIEGGGLLVLGQEQDARGGRFSTVESFVGTLRLMNIWDKVLTSQEIYNISRSCEVVGTVRAWPDFLNGTQGQVMVSETRFCLNCSVPESTDNGNVELTGLTTDSIASYECIPGYEMKGEDQRKCMIYSEWSGDPPICQKKNCGYLRRPSNGRIRGFIYKFGHSVTYECNEDYKLVGNATRYCNESGLWTGKAPTCELIKCIPPPSERPLRIMRARPFYQPGDSISLSCYTGYSLKGQRLVKCGADGNWESNFPSCDQIFCRNPPTVVHAHSLEKNDSSFPVSAVARYACDIGYEMLGRGNVQCRIDGNWKRDLPVCTIKMCGRPAMIENGHMNGSVYTYNATVYYQCRTGYNIIGESQSKCLETGKWNVSPPRCQIISCPNLEQLANGRADVKSLVFNSRVDYQCNKGFILEGRPIRRCLENGTWTGVQPVCNIVTCQQPGDIDNGEVETEDIVYNSTARYVCKKGFLRNGVETRTCLEDGTWSDTSPRCEVITCPNPDHIANGTVNVDTVVFNAKIHYSCNVGYRLQGESEMTCLENGTWSGEQPVCEIIICNTPSPVENGLIAGNDYSFGRSLLYSCDEGYRLMGLSKRVCGETGKWQSPAPLCKPVRCQDPDKIENGHIIGTNYFYDNIIEMTCASGFFVSGSQKRRCLSNGTWSGEDPLCKMIKCPKPVPINHGLATEKTDYYQGATIKYSCEIGYQIEGKQTRTCRGDGTWTGPTPKCVSIRCYKPNSISNGNYTLADMMYGSNVEYVCDQGFELSGPEKRTCTGNKHWSGSEPTCGQIVCPEPVEIAYGKFNGNSYVNGSIITYSCLPGYSMRGEPDLMCLENKTWSGQPPECIIKECVKPSHVISNGRLIGKNFTYTSKISYVCDSGYFIEESTSRTCQADGTWDKGIPTCERVECPRPLPPPNTNLEGFDFRYKEHVTYICKVGFELVGPLRRICQSDKTWSGREPRCVQIQCPEPPNILNGRALKRGIFLKNRIIYQCNAGYTLVGPRERHCQKNKTWSHSVPKCVKTPCDQPPAIDNGESRNKIVVAGDTVHYKCKEGHVLREAGNLRCSLQGEYIGEPPECIRVECGSPDEIENGEVVVVGQSFNDTVRYVCLEGYTIQGNSFRHCDESGIWAGDIPKCIKTKCSPPTQILHGKSNAADGYGIGKVIDYTCDEGYKLLGHVKHTCLKNATWDGEVPVCSEVECTYPSLQFGYIATSTGDSKDEGQVRKINRFLYRMTVSLDCEKGYKLVGARELTCQPNGTWSKEFPTCVRIKCPKPAIPNAILRAPLGFEYGRRVLVSCNMGYDLHGESELYCKADRRWSKSFPKCKLVSCAAPIVPNSKPRILESPNTGVGYPYGIRLNFTCKTGYVLSGHSDVKCQSDKAWSHALPVCTKIYCNVPEYKDHRLRISYKKNRYQYGESVTFSCRSGFTLIGSSVLTCGEGKIWKGTPPTCRMSECPKLNISNGYIYSDISRFVTRFFLGVTVSVRCDLGYVLQGTSTLKCQDNKTWFPTPPSCVPKKCYRQSIENGKIFIRSDISDDTFGTKIFFQCNNGYYLNGTSSLTCLKNGSWSDFWPACEPVRCPDPNINNSVIKPEQKERFQFDDEIEVDCLPGYQLFGFGELRCTAEGKWSTRLPTCTAVKCRTPSINHGSIKVVEGSDAYEFETRILYLCNQGYILKGGNESICLANKTWSKTGSTSFCQIVSCPIPEIPHSLILNQNATYRSSIDVKCNLGYELSGNSKLSCGEDGTWSKPWPSCNLVECPTPSIANGMYVSTTNTTGPLTFGESVEFDCNEGYELHGQPVALCLPNKHWSEKIPLCKRVICSSPPLGLDNGNIDFVYASKKGVYSYQTELHFKCNPGFQLEGNKLSTCLANKTWSENEPKCKQLYCQEPDLTNGNLKTINKGQGGNFTFGHSIQFNCVPGFDLVGAGELLCQADGTWSFTFPSCSRKECPPPKSITHGRIIGKSHKFEDTVAYACNEGYELDGSSKTHCQANGTWSMEPTCNMIRCVEPILKHGYLSIVEGDIGYSYNTILSYSCDPGYILNGRNESRCLANKTWSNFDSPPFCQIVSCPILEIPQASILDKNFTYGSFVDVKCNLGYELSGNSKLSCGEDGTWSKPWPSCNLVECPTPSIDNGRYVSTTNTTGPLTFGESVEFDCNEGYELHGQPVALCLPNKHWSEKIPLCKRVICSSPPVGLDNGNIDFVYPNKKWVYSYQTELHFKCNPGFQLEGNNVSTCLANKTWSENAPKCKQLYCQEPDLKNGNLKTINKGQGGNFTFGHSIQFNCVPGFDLVGAGELLCQADGTWSFTFPSCSRKECPPPKSITHGRIIGKSHKFEDTVAYVCNEGYELDGSSKTHCQANGTWSMEPTCNMIRCVEPILKHGYLSIVEGDIGYSYNTILSYSCDPGYILNGRNKSRCLANKTWSNFDSPPFCQIVSCPILEIPQASILDKNFTYGSFVDVKCNLGYELSGNSKLSCGEDGTWSKPWPSCNLVVCPTPSIDNGRYVSTTNTTGPLTFGESVEFDCNEGYELHGQPVALCLPSKHWSEKIPLCKRVICSSPPLGLDNGNIDLVYASKKGVYSYQTELHFKCNPGFQLEGNNVSTCLANKTWSENEPKCKQLYCQEPDLKNGNLKTINKGQGGNFTFGHSIQFNCVPGFDLVGAGELLCQADGTWSFTFPSCSRKECPPPKSITHGRIIGKSHNFEDTVAYVCNEGYELDGSSKIHCQANGTWSMEPTCNVIRCVEPILKHGYLSIVEGDIGYSYNTILSYSCDPGYILNGRNESRCLANKTWSNFDSPPFCQIVSCPILEIPQALILDKNFTYGSFVDIKCNLGYELSGHYKLSCGEDGTWSKPLPSCNLVECPTPSIDNGRYVSTTNTTGPLTFGESVEFDCNEGYELHGEPVALCLPNKHWSEKIPLCKRVICSSPPLGLDNGNIDFLYASKKGVYSYQTELHFKCNPGFQLEGNNVSTCLANKTWSENEPKCKQLYCQEPDFKDGNLKTINKGQGGNFTFGHSIQFNCVPGFDLVGAGELLCQADGTWSFTFPSCSRKECPPPKSITHGRIIGKSHKFDDFITYACDEGYELEGSSKVRCEASGQWRTESTCKVINCPKPILNHGSVNILNGDSTYSYKSTVVHACDKGYILKGSTESHCQANKTWSYRQGVPFCQIITCDKPHIVNSVTLSTNTTYGVTIYVECRLGYEIAGDSNLTCTAEGVWSAHLPSCIPTICPDPEISNGRFFSITDTPGPFTFGESVTFLCDVGYQLEGKSTALCLPNKSWSEKLPTCNRVKCRNQALHIENGSVLVTYAEKVGVYSYETTLSFQCKLGFRLEGSAQIICASNKEWSDSFPLCQQLYCPVPVFQNGIMKEERAQKDGKFIYKDSVRFICNPGFELNGESEIMCQGDGTWTAAMPNCARVECLPPKPVRNGRIIGGSFKFEDSIIYICDVGYEVHGSAEVRCLANQKWSSNPTCKPIKCPLPPNIEHGEYMAEFITKSFDYKSRIRYACNRGYILKGEQDHQCLANKSWSGVIPQCNRVSCPAPPIIMFGKLFGKGKLFGDTLRIKCSMGYELIGKNTIHCLWNRRWSPLAATCRIVACPNPAVPENGKIDGGPYIYGQTINYICDPGYQLLGEEKRTCLETKAWSGKIPSCFRISCGKPESIANGFFEGNNYKFESIVKYACDKGYTLTGKSERHCLSDGSWGGVSPRCDIIKCRSLKPILHGKVIAESMNYGSVAEYRCDYGYKMTGSAFHICKEDGTWEGSEPRCRKLSCPPPVDIDNGYFEGNDFTFNGLTIYKCKDLHELIGNVERRCQGDGTWSGTTPHCRKKKCQTPPNYLNGRMVGDDFTAGSSISFLCDEGYHLVGQKSVTCKDGNNWSGEFPQCDKISCGLPKPIENSIINSNTYEYDDTVTVRCATGYQIRGDPIMTCQANGKWTPAKAKCVPRTCGEPQHVEHAFFNGNSFNFGDYIFYKCDPGYDLNGSNLIQCDANGKWVGNLPVCLETSCGQPPVLFHATTVVSKTTYGSKAIYQCNRGYHLKGSSMIQCSDNATWVYNERPACVPVNCGRPPGLGNGAAKVPDFTLGNIARYYCLEGHVLSGNPVIQCTDEGNWNGTAPICNPISCDEPVPPRNGGVEGNDFHFGNDILYFCKKGFLVVGNAVRTCQPNGHWSGTNPRCDLIYCGRPHVPENANVTMTGHHYDSVVKYTCAEGYKMIGNDTARCTEEGVWNVPPPTCVLEVDPCPQPPKPNNTRSISGAFVVGDTVSLVCNEGYRPTGDLIIICQEDLTWTEPTGSCQMWKSDCPLPKIGLPVNAIAITGDFIVGDTIRLSCEPGYKSTDALDITCQNDMTWTVPVGTCEKVHCGPPQVNPYQVRLKGNSYYYGDRVQYSCRRGLKPAKNPFITCQADGQWDSRAECKATCKFPCKNGGTCISPNRCKCRPGYSGRFCHNVICILPCLNGGKCTAPYKCSCRHGYSGARCEMPVCKPACKNGGKCIRANRCKCPHDFKPPFCEREMRRIL